MKEDIAALKASDQRLRADLMATNLALAAIASVLTTEQQRQMLKALAELGVMQEQSFERLGQESLLSMQQAANQRMYSALEGTMKMRQAKAGG